MNIKKLVFDFKNNLFRFPVVLIDKNLRTNVNKSKLELKSQELENLKKIFSYAKKNVPYYMRKFENIEVEDIKSFDDWEKVPVLTKQDIKDNSKDLIALNISTKRLNKVTTGGSTGVPLTLYHDKKFPLEVLSWRVLNWWGIDPSDNIAFIFRKVRTGLKATLNSLIWYPTKRLFLDASLMTDKSMEEFYDKLMRIKPTIIQGYVGGVFEFAKFCQRNNYNIDFLKAVWVTSAPLSEPSRKVMENIFNAPVYDQYGCGEVYWIAAECSKKEGLHVLSDVRYLEILDDTNRVVPTGEYGDITLTDLVNYAFPLIRYKNGDTGRYLDHDCSCGIPFPLIDKIKGRITDVLTFQSGKVIAGDYLTTIFDDYPDAVQAFQVYQYKDYSLALYCVLGVVENAYDICTQKVNEFKELLENEVSVELKIVDEIKHDEGKTRFIISEVKRDNE